MAATSVHRNRTNPTNIYTSVVLAASTINGTYLWCYLVFASLCFVLGFGGNLLILIVMLRRNLWRRSFSRMFVQLAVCDTLVLIGYFAKYINVISYAFYGKLLVKPSTRIQCILFEYFISVGLSSSPWTLVLVSAERMCVVCFPFRGPRFWSPNTASKLCFSVICFIALIYSFLFVTIDVSDNGCTFKDVLTFTKPLLSSILISIGPCISLAITSAITSITLFNKRGDSGTTRASKYSNQVTVLVLVLCVFFMVTTFPATLVSPHVGTNAGLKKIFTALTDILMINFSFNLYLYLMTGKEIRNELRSLCFAKKPS
ncbi:rhodopsin-like [Tubulanus polymorphus]|uniref:rhodopsin-like n=1 Tax=Tubulanus polymorphus TaxID=672921 RepID=UPI003DA6CC1F